MYISIRTLTVFYHTATLLNMAATSRKMHMTPPAVTKHIKNLEKTLGDKLFGISGKQIYLTQLGEQLLILTQQYLQQTDEFMQQIGTLNIEKNETIKVSMLSTFQHLFLPSITEFTRSHFNIQLELTTGSWKESQDDIGYGKHDFYLMGNPKSYSSDYNIDVLYRFQLKLICNPTHRLANTTITAAELHNEQFLNGGTPSSTTKAEAELLKLWNVATQPFVFDSYLSATNAVKAGIGIGLLPDRLIDESLDAGELAEIHIDFEKESYPIVLMWHKNKKMTPAMASFRDMILADIQP